MVLTISSREQLSYQKTALEFSMKSGGIFAQPPASLAIKTDQVQLSDASRTAMQYTLQESNLSANWSDTELDLGDGIKANARFSLNYAERLESLNLSFTFSAESLGYTQENFKAFGGKPIELKFEFFQQTIEYVKESKLTIQETKRTAEEIITDIANALRDVFLKKGDKSVLLSMDADAFQTLLENADTRSMLDDIVALIGLINDMRTNGGARDHYQIYISGKGKPKIDYEESVDVKVEGSRISIRVTIQPPLEAAGHSENTPTESMPALNEEAIS